MVLLTAFLEIPGWGKNQGLHLVEFFAGVARPARLGHWIGLKSRAFEIRYCPVKHPTKKKRGKFRRSPMVLQGWCFLMAIMLNLQTRKYIYIENDFIKNNIIFDSELAIWNDTSSLTNKNERTHVVQKSNYCIKLVCFSSSGPGWL